jgi:hypothetical protein
VLLVVLALGTPARAQTSPVTGPLATAKGLHCTFPVFGTARWTDLGPETLDGTQEFAFDIDTIDYRRGRARLVASGTTLMTMLLTETGMHVIEQTPIGNLNLTTIFSAESDGRTFRAVHSRHLGDLTAAPRASQSYGLCELTP